MSAVVKSNHQCTDDTCIFARTLTSAQFCSVHPMVVQKRYKPKEVIFHQGSRAACLYILTSGYIKLSTTLSDGRIQGIRLMKSGQIAGLDTLAAQRHNVTATAVTEVSACMVRHKDVLNLLEQNRSLLFTVIGSLAAELQQSEETICRLGALSAAERVAAFLLMLAEDETHEKNETRLPLLRWEMAELLGLAIETASRVMSMLVRARIIETRERSGWFRILDKARLIALSGSGWHRVSGRNTARWGTLTHTGSRFDLQ